MMTAARAHADPRAVLRASVSSPTKSITALADAFRPRPPRALRSARSHTRFEIILYDRRRVGGGGAAELVRPWNGFSRTCDPVKTCRRLPLSGLRWRGGNGGDQARYEETGDPSPGCADGLRILRSRRVLPTPMSRRSAATACVPKRMLEEDGVQQTGSRLRSDHGRRCRFCMRSADESMKLERMGVG